MSKLHVRHALAALARAAVLAAALAGPAGAIQMSAGSGAGIAGQTVDIALSVTSTTGHAIRSFQFDLSYFAPYVTATDVLEAGTLVGTAGWGDATWNVTTAGNNGKISVSHAGTTDLSGAGVLLQIRFQINPALLAGGSTSLTLANLVFNEGTPNDTTSNGSITINATPIITVSPNSGEVVRTQTLQFNVSGSVTNPVTWSTTDNAVATISGTGLLTGVAPGQVKVVAVDAAARRDTSDGFVQVRGMGLTAGSGATYVNNPVAIPLTVTDLSGLGVRAGQVTLTFNGAYLTATGFTTPPGTLLDGYGTVTFGAASGTCTVDFAGSTDLSGSGVLGYVEFAAGPTPAFVFLTVATALFNETLPARPTHGSVTINALPTITVNPDTRTMLVGETHTFTLSGSPVPPITWSVTNPAVASIDGTGLLTALLGGTTRVQATDDVGATDLNTLVDVYDFRVTAGTINVVPGGFVSLPIYADRKVGALGIRSVQYELGWSGPHVTAVSATPFGLIAAWSPNLIATTPQAGRWRLVAAGAQPLANTDSVLHRVRFDISPSAPDGTDIPITIVSFLCNEGTPRQLTTNGVIRVRTVVGVPDGGVPAALALAPPRPNPAAGRLLLRFAIPAAGADGERVRLDLLGVDGRRVRTLVDASFPPGTHEALWDGRDDGGQPVPAGIYLARVAWMGRSATRKVVMVP